MKAIDKMIERAAQRRAVAAGHQAGSLSHFFQSLGRHAQALETKKELARK